MEITNVTELEQFKAKVVFSMEAEGFVIKTASTPEDLKLALKLRHQVFLEEGLAVAQKPGLNSTAMNPQQTT